MDIEESVRRAFRDRGRRAQADRGWTCPDDSRVAAFVDGALDESACARVRRHVERCERCRQQVAFLQAHADAEPLPDVPAALLARARALPPNADRARPLAGGAPFAQWWRWAPLAAATLAAAVYFVVPRSTVAPPLVVPPPSLAVPAAGSPPSPASAQRVQPSSAPEARRAVPSLSSAPRLLYPTENVTVAVHDGMPVRWKGTPEAMFYEVRLAASSGELIWETRTEQREVRVPADARITARDKYYLWVVAYLPDGKSIQSKSVGFHAAR